jgi:hypothetical protein
LLVALVGVTGAAETVRLLQAPAGAARAPAAPAAPIAAPAGDFHLVLRSTARLPVPPGAPSAHAASLAWRPTSVPAGQAEAPAAGGSLLAVWWAGSRESGPDVRVYLSTLGAQGWSSPRAIVDRETLGAALGFGVRRIGNAVIHVGAGGRLHLFVVATGLGGWAAGRVVHLEAPDPTSPFAVRRVLALSPLANTSVLVRAQALPRPDGGWWLPAYFELGVKQPWLLGFDAEGTMTQQTRIGHSQTSLQPTLLRAADGALVALMRDHGSQRRIQQAESRDGGATWRDLEPLPLANVDTAVAVTALSDPAGRGDAWGQVLAHNDTEVPGTTPRSVLRLRFSRDGRAWSPGPVVQGAEPGAEFSYPNLLQVGSQLHAVYTHRREGIGHVVFDVVPGTAP